MSWGTRYQLSVGETTERERLMQLVVNTANSIRILTRQMSYNGADHTYYAKVIRRQSDALVRYVEALGREKEEK